jgi:hypothetical protein
MQKEEGKKKKKDGRKGGIGVAGRSEREHNRNAQLSRSTLGA